MIQPLARFAVRATLLVCVLGSGPCYDDDCSPAGKTWCRDNVAFYCGDPGEDVAWRLYETPCTEGVEVCVVVDDVERGRGQKAICVPAACGDGGPCPDASVCEGDACVSDAGVDARTD